jgi:hypothetical protein
MKQNGLAMNWGNLPKTYIVETTIVTKPPIAVVTKKKGEKSGFILAKVLKRNVEKMPVFRLSTIFMKTSELWHSLHDVDENKASCRLQAIRVNALMPPIRTQSHIYFSGAV